MSAQSPLISIPRKTTTDVDWTGPIRAIIGQSYGEDPKNYAEECSVLQRCRQDAVKGAGSDQTARDLMYKYFGQLELLELRFAEIKVPFIWNDAFTLKPTTQTSLAFEKASIIHLLASVLSSIAAIGSRADPEGIKRAYFNSRASAGMLTYINENFLHAPSVDLGREVVHFLIGLLMAQSTEVFTEKLISEKKSPALVCRSANSAAGMYSTLVDEMKEFQGKGVFDRNWLYIIQIKARLFLSMAQHYRSVADAAAGKHGAALVRLKQADASAQDALKQATNLSYTFYAAATPSLPSDAATSLSEIAKAHASLCTEAKDQAIRDNELIYHDILPSETSLPSIEKLPAAAPITIQEVYANPDVSKLIGPDIFIRLVPLAVHESASVYSEEKAKLVRGEVERVDLSEGQIRASLEHLGLPAVLSSWRRIVDGDADDEVQISSTLQRLAPDIASSSIDAQLRDLEAQRSRCERELHELSALLDNESRECERMRAKHAPQFTQGPSGQQTGHFRQTITSNLGAISAAAASDQRLNELWQQVAPDVAIIAKGDLQTLAQQIASGKQVQRNVDLLDLDDSAESGASLSSAETEALALAIQTDDVSNLLLLNRRSQHVEPQLFASELEKFRPYQGRITSALQASEQVIAELESIIRQSERSKGIKERQRGAKDRQKRVREWEKQLEVAADHWSEVNAGAGKGLSFYESMSLVLRELSAEVKSWVQRRETERNRMVGDIETRARLEPSSTGSTSGTLEARLTGLSLGGHARDTYSTSPVPPKPVSQSSYSTYAPSPPAPPKSVYPTTGYAPPAQASSYSSPTSPYPAPPPSQLSGSQYGSRTSAYPAPPPSQPTSSPYPTSPSYATGPSYPAPPAQVPEHSYQSAYPPPPPRPHHAQSPPPQSYSQYMSPYPQAPPPQPYGHAPPLSYGQAPSQAYPSQPPPAGYPRAPPPPPAGSTYPYAQGSQGSQGYPYR